MVASRLQGCVRESDTVARLGGDEFVVILPNIDSHDSVKAVADKIIESISSKFVLTQSSREVSIGASIGIAIYPLDAEDSDGLLKAAAAAMYAAKQVGGCCRFYKAGATGE